MPTSTTRRRRPRMRALVLAAGAACAAALSAVPAAHAIPFRGHVPLVVVLCKTSDHPADPARAIAGVNEAGTPAFYRRFFTAAGSGTRNLADYFEEQAYGKVDFSNAVVKGWYTMTQTEAQEGALGGGGSPTRQVKIDHCLNAAAASTTDPYRPPANAHVVAFVNTPIDLFGSYRRSYVNSAANFAEIAHEIGHNLGLNHSFGDNATGGTDEYGDWYDLMSCMRCAGFGGQPYGTSPPLMIAAQRDRMGWIPGDRIATFGANGATSASYTIGAVNSVINSGHMLVRVPIGTDPFHYYTVEIHRKESWADALPSSMVLVHEIKPDGRISLVGSRNLFSPGQVFSKGAVTVRLDSGWSNGGNVTISGDVALQCLPGYVWRTARASDLVCVTPATRQQTLADNAAAPSRTLPNGYCVSGYVWRNAYNGDGVCVTPATRTQAQADNAAHASRVNPARSVAGPNMCSSGYVWRSGDAGDFVCVTPATRAQVAADNAAAPSRTLPNRYCVSGYVWRDAWTGDLACVPPASRTQAKDDNLAAGSRMVRPNG